jgi:hypothetical protein
MHARLTIGLQRQSRKAGASPAGSGVRVMKPGLALADTSW